MFPDASLSLVEGLYKGNPVADLFNDMLTVQVLAHLLEQRLRARGASSICILESARVRAEPPPVSCVAQAV